MKKRITAMAAACLLLFSGCEWTQISVDTLLTPPVLMNQQKQIDEALKKEVGGGKTVNLVYPKSGNLRSAYLFSNLDEEPGDEAIVFYRVTDSGATTGSLKITLLDEIENEWTAVWTSDELPANEVEKVSVVDEGGEHLLVLGITLFSSDSGNNQQMMVYRYRDQTLRELVTAECAAHSVCDLDRDGTLELMTIVKGVVGEHSPAETTATRYVWEQRTFMAAQQTTLDPQVTAYVLTEGTTADGIRALFVDGTRGKEQITELLAVSDGNLVNLLAGEDTLRPAGLTALDFNHDGAVELPLGWMDKEQNELYRVNWHSVTAEGLQLKQRTYTDFANGYYFTLPEWFDEGVSFRRSADGSAVAFYEQAEEKERLLFELQVFAYHSLTDGKLPVGYVELERDGQLVYAVRMGSEQTSIRLTVQEIQEVFALL